jgi:ribose transport system permease protein
MSTQATAPSPTAGGTSVDAEPSLGRRALRTLVAAPEAGVITACVAVFIIFALWSPHHTFASQANLQGIGLDLAQVGVLAVGEALVILTGGVDLSVGALAGLAAIIVAWLNVNAKLPALVAILLTLIGTTLVGLWHGFTVTKLKVPPFVITLVTYTTAIGLALAITTGTPITNVSTLFNNISVAHFVGSQMLTAPFLVFVIVVLALWFFLERTYVGRQIYASGGNAEAARLAGIPVARRVTTVYMISGLLAGVVGVLVVGRMNVADPSVASTGWELQAIAAAVIGGVSMFGGEGRMIGIAAGALLLEFITNGLASVNFNVYSRNVIIGLVLGLAVLADRLRARYFGRGNR